MAGRKGRKPDGIAGLIAGVVSDQQKARTQTRRLEARADLAWAKEEAKVAAADARQQAKRDRQNERESRK
jgi:hypothetical protein